MRFDAPLFFANGAIFDDYVRSRVDAAGPGIHTVILAAEPITDIDTTAMDELIELDDYLATNGIRLILAEMKDPVIDVLRRYGLTDRFTPDRFAATVGAAVDDLTGRLRGDLDGAERAGPSPAGLQRARAIGAKRPAVTAMRSSGESSRSRPRRPPDTRIVSQRIADSSSTVGSAVFCPIGLMPPTT